MSDFYNDYLKYITDKLSTINSDLSKINDELNKIYDSLTHIYNNCVVEGITFKQINSLKFDMNYIASYNKSDVYNTIIISTESIPKSILQIYLMSFLNKSTKKFRLERLKEFYLDCKLIDNGLFYSLTKEDNFQVQKDIANGDIHNFGFDIGSIQVVRSKHTEKQRKVNWVESLDNLKEVALLHDKAFLVTDCDTIAMPKDKFNHLIKGLDGIIYNKKTCREGIKYLTFFDDIDRNIVIWNKNKCFLKNKEKYCFQPSTNKDFGKIGAISEYMKTIKSKEDILEERALGLRKKIYVLTQFDSLHYLKYQDDIQ